jgi:protein SCO1/2
MGARRTNFKRIPLGHRLALGALFALTAGAVYLAATWMPEARAQYRPDRVESGTPVAIPNPEVVERPNAVIPLDLEFTRSDGATVKLGDFFNKGKPVVMTMVYFSCPNLCGYVQDDLINAIRSGPRSLKLGKDYDVVIVSIDPDDTPAQAEARRLKYLGIADRPPTQEGLIYLTGREENIRKLADTIGYGYRRNFGVAEDDAAGKFAHSAGVFVCTPYGRLSQTILGIGWPTDKLHYALLQASDNKIGSGFLETIALPCGAVRLGAHGYEHNPWFWAGTAGGAATFAFMAIFLGVMWRGEWKRKRQSDMTGNPAIHGT